MSFATQLKGPLGVVLAPLGWVYARFAKARINAYHSGRKKSVKPPMPTLSIGNIAAGGTGKTPLLFAALDWLQKQDATIGVLSRGYGGDEGRMLEERFPAVHLVEGANRVAGLEQLQRKDPPELLLLDDGFQHLKLQRDVDVVVIDATNPFGRCFPAGLFREPISALQRADLVVVSRADLVSERTLLSIWKRIHRARKGKPYQQRVEGRMQARDLRNLKTGVCAPISEFKDRHVQLAAGIGNPSSFQRMCEEAGMKIREFTRYSDHHAWTARDAQSFDPALPLLVTEKDGVKLRPFATVQMWELRVDWEFVRGVEVWQRCLTNFHLPVRAARIEPLWNAHDPTGRAAT